MAIPSPISRKLREALGQEAGEALVTWLNEMRAENEKLRAAIDARFDKVDQLFDRVHERFNQVDERFDMVGERFDRVDERFDKVDQRVDKLDARVGTVALQCVALAGVGCRIPGTGRGAPRSAADQRDYAGRV